MHPELTDNIARRNRTNGRFRYLVIAGSVITVVPIFLIVGNLAIKGYRQINLAFFTKPAPDTFQAMMAAASGEIIPGGIANGLTGSLLMVLLASFIAIPLGLMTGIFVYENGTRRYARFIRSLVKVNAMPTYDYHCNQCQSDFSAMHKMSEPAPQCPQCGGPVTKKLSAPAVHHAGGQAASATAPVASHGCGAGSCGCRH